MQRTAQIKIEKFVGGRGDVASLKQARSGKAGYKAFTLSHLAQFTHLVD